MIKAILLDLDNTLYHNPDTLFVGAYLRLVEQFFSDYWGREGLSLVVRDMARLMAAEHDMRQSNSALALSAIAEKIKRPVDEVREGFNQFYRQAYPALRDCGEMVRSADELVRYVMDAGYVVVIATNPIYPAEAIQQRLNWAGLPDDLSHYALVTHSDNMHFIKPNPAYYAEIVARVGVEPDEAIMVGDNIRNDIAAAQQAGLYTFYIQGADISADHQADKAGSLHDFYQIIHQEEWRNSCLPRPLSPDMIEPELRGNIGALFGTLGSIQTHFWTQHPDPNEWSPIQIVCHLMESESTIQRPRLERILNEANPFLAAPQPPLGPQEALPCSDDGLWAAAQFAQERQVTIEFLRQIKADEWKRPARHSIFGLTTLLEMAHFTAQHDRLHINQLCQTLGKCK